jgi:4-phytase/acid phosphatase
MKGRTFSLALILLIGASACFERSYAASSATLERVVIVQRHGVRAPTKDPASLSRYSAERWPDWPVAVAELTPHGADNVRFMGTWLRAHYAQDGLWWAQGCPAPDSIAAWADGANQRTRVSGQTTLDGAFPGCGLVAQHAPEDRKDSLFDAIETGVCPLDPEAARKAVLAAAGGDLNAPDAALETANALLYDILSPPASRHACADDKGTCFLNGKNTLQADAEGIKLSGPLATASTMVENLLLEYGQGMPLDQVGWGRADASALAKIGILHNRAADLTRRTRYIAAHNGARMAQAVIAALQGRPAFPGSKGGEKFLVIAGHDTNLSNLAGILGVDWTLSEQPDKTPPGGTLAFELWRDGSGTKFVKVRFFYETLEQLRTGETLDDSHPARQIDLALPGCANGPGGECSLPDFVRSVETALPHECLDSTPKP